MNFNLVLVCMNIFFLVKPLFMTTKNKELVRNAKKAQLSVIVTY